MGALGSLLERKSRAEALIRLTGPTPNFQQLGSIANAARKDLPINVAGMDRALHIRMVRTYRYAEMNHPAIED